MVRQLVEYLRLHGFRYIRAHLPEHIIPDRIFWNDTGKGHIPDVTGKDSELHIYEVETQESIDYPHTSDQWKLFAAYAAQFNAVFVVVVPDGYGLTALHRLEDLRIQAEVMEV